MCPFTLSHPHSIFDHLVCSRRARQAAPPSRLLKPLQIRHPPHRYLDLNQPSANIPRVDVFSPGQPSRSARRRGLPDRAIPLRSRLTPSLLRLIFPRPHCPNRLNWVLVTPSASWRCRQQLRRRVRGRRSPPRITCARRMPPGQSEGCVASEPPRRPSGAKHTPQSCGSGRASRRRSFRRSCTPRSTPTPARRSAPPPPRGSRAGPPRSSPDRPARRANPRCGRARGRTGLESHATP